MINSVTPRFFGRHFGHGRGFTLIELMLTVAMIAIVAIVAYPSYQNYLVRARLSEARVALQKTALWLQRQANTSGSFGTDIEGNTINPDRLDALGMRYIPEGSTASNANYYLRFPTGSGCGPTNPGSACFLLFATAQGKQRTADPDCQDLTIDQLQRKGRFSGGVKYDDIATNCWSK